MIFFKKLFFTIIRRLYYLINKLYFNFFLILKKKENTNNKNIDFEKFFEKKFFEFKNEYREIYNKINIEDFKKKAIISCIDLPAANDRSNFNHGIILCKLLDDYIKNNNKNFEILEVGSARGYTSLCMSQAIINNQDKSKIFSLDVIGNNNKFFQKTYIGNKKVSRSDILKNFSHELLKNIIFIQADTYSDLEKITFHNLKFAFIDGEHNFKYLSKELEFCNKFLLKDGLIIVDDYNEREFHEVIKCVNFFAKNCNYDLKIIKYGKNSNFAVLKRK